MATNKIKKERSLLGFSIYELAERTGLTPGYISNLERGERDNPSKDTMESIAKALNKTVSEIFFPND